MTEGEEIPSGEIILFTAQDGHSKIQVRIEGETVWLPQRGIAELYEMSVKTVNEHLINIYDERELSHEATIRKFRIVQHEGKREVSRLVDHYNLDAILAVGYRVRSHRGTLFRQWATAQLKEYLVKGFVMDDERLKSERPPVQDYFDELLERIRSIRASERRFYQKITDIYATSQDYDPRSEITETFYATVQNKLHWAIHGQTAAEVIESRADHSKPNMGLTSWKNSPSGPIRKSDISVAKNYLDAEELSALNRIVTMYLDYAETQAQSRKPMNMVDWIKKLDDFLKFNERNILTHSGKISQSLALSHAEREFEKYDTQSLNASSSDFDQWIGKTKLLGKGTNRPTKNKKKRPAKK